MEMSLAAVVTGRSMPGKAWFCFGTCSVASSVESSRLRTHLLLRVTVLHVTGHRSPGRRQPKYPQTSSTFLTKEVSRRQQSAALLNAMYVSVQYLLIIAPAHCTVLEQNS